MNSLIWVLPILIAVLDRLGGNGHKWARRYIIPILLYFVSPSLSNALFCLFLSMILSFNLNEIEKEHHVPAKRDWEECFLHPFGIAFCIYNIAGLWALMVPLWWLFGIYWSNEGLKAEKTADSVYHKTGRRWIFGPNYLPWQYVEIFRGFFIGLSICLHFFN